MKVSAYVSCYNAWATLSRGGAPDCRSDSVGSEDFAIDDGSKDGFGDLSGVKIVRLASNAGPGTARARAMTEAHHKLFLGCDANMILDRYFLENALPLFSGDLKATSGLSNSVMGVLDRYTRWNTTNSVSARGYLRQLTTP